MGYITKEGLEKLKKGLKKLKIDTRREIAKRLKESKLSGDLRENSEYDAARNAWAFNEGRIVELEESIKNAVLIKPSKNKKIQVGSVIKARITSSSEERIFAIVGSREADPVQGKISNESPLGRAFLGHQIGDIIEAETPKGKTGYRIIEIE